jgi:hypothetical protein
MDNFFYWSGIKFASLAKELHFLWIILIIRGYTDDLGG